MTNLQRALFFFTVLTVTSCLAGSPKVTILENQITVELAFSEEKRAEGLMHRSTLKNNHGMLFIYPEAFRLNFWMKNTFIPLSIAFIDENRKIVSIQKMDIETGPSYKSYSSPLPAKFALEMPQGWFEQKNISAGETVDFSRAVEKAVRKAE